MEKKRMMKSLCIMLVLAMCLPVFAACTEQQHQHVMGNWVVDTEATCTEQGEKHIACSECNEVMITDTIPAKGHTAGEWIIDVDSTEKTEGSKHRECAVCKTTLDTQSIPTKALMTSEELAAYVQARTVTMVINGDVNGTGFFIDDKGTLVTCFHVIRSALWKDNGSIQVKLPDGGGTYDMETMIKFDPAYDLAVLKIDTGVKKTPYLEIAGTEAVAGARVYACGSSLGLATGNFSDGQISTASHKHGLTDSYLSSANIYSGNSGGPLVNAYGEVVGISAAGYSRAGNDTLNIFIKTTNLEKLRIVGNKTFSELRQWHSFETRDALNMFIYSVDKDKYTGYYYNSYIHSYHDETGAKCLFSSNTNQAYRGGENGYDPMKYYYTYQYDKSQYNEFVEYLKSEGYTYQEDLGGDKGGGTFVDIYYSDIDYSYIEIYTYTWNGQRLLQVDMYIFE